MGERFTASVGAGTLLDDGADCFVVPHRWTSTGMSVRGDFTGVHVMHLAVACSVLDDVYREADRRGVQVNGVHVTAEGGFDADTWLSTGVEYAVAIDSALLPEAVDRLVGAVERVAAVPRALRQGVGVRRVGHV